MNKVDIQLADSTNPSSGAFDVLVNGDHYERHYSHSDAVNSARQAAGNAPNVIIRDFTQPFAGKKYTVVEL